MASYNRKLRKFEPGTHQGERFSFSRDAVMAHRKYGRSDVGTITLASPRKFTSAKASATTKLSNHLNQLDIQLKGLSQSEKMRFLFPKLARKTSSSPFITPEVKNIFAIGGATPSEFLKKRMSPRRLGEILSNYYKAEGIRVISGGQELFKYLVSAGGPKPEVAKFVDAARAGVGGATKGFPYTGERGVFISSKEEILYKAKAGREAGIYEYARRFESPNRAKLQIGAHEAIEHLYIGNKVIGEGVASHQSYKIYAAEMEFAAMLDSSSVRNIVTKRQQEIPKVIEDVKKWTDPKKREVALKELRNLPNTYEKILRKRGYSDTDIRSFLSPINLASRQKNTPSPKITRQVRKGRKLRKFGSGTFQERRFRLAKQAVVAHRQSPPKLPNIGKEESHRLLAAAKKESSRHIEELKLKTSLGVDSTQTTQAIQTSRGLREANKRNVSLREHQSIGTNTIIKPPEKQKLENAARRTIQSVKEKKALNVAELDLPQVLENYVSQGVKEVKAAEKLGSLRKVAPYAVGALVGADILASRDKTGPFWGGLAAGAAWLLTRGKVSKNARLLAAGTSYAGVRIAVGALDASHSGQIEGFEEQFGFTPAIRDSNSDFGSGWKGISGSLEKRLSRNITGMDERGEASIERKQLTQFSSPFQGLKSLMGHFGETISRVFKRGTLEGGTRGSDIVKKIIPGQRTPVQWFGREELHAGILQYAMEQGMNEGLVKEALTKTSVAVTSPPPRIIKPIIGGNTPNVGTLPTLAMDPNRGFKVANPQAIATLKTLTPEDLRLQQVAENLQGSGFKVANPQAMAYLETVTPGDLKLEKAIEKLERAPIDVTAQTLFGRDNKKSLMIGEGPTLSMEAVLSSERKYAQAHADMAYSSPHGARMRAHKPKILESFRKEGITGYTRKINTEGDFGTGWDPARRLAKALFGKSAKEGIETAARGEAFREILGSQKFQEALGRGKVIKQLGAGGVGSVELMETTIGEGAEAVKFKYARKQYFVKPDPTKGEAGLLKAKESASHSLESEFSGLRPIQESIGPTPYGRGEIAVKGKDVPVMYFEAIEGAKVGFEAFEIQGGATKEQVKSLKKAVKQLHDAGLYHSDIKPANMLVDKEGRLVLIDPMPSRYKFFGKEFSKKVGQTQDLMAVDMLAAGGSPADVRLSMNIFANSVLVGLSGPAKKTKKVYDKALKYTQDIFKRAGAQVIAEAYNIPMASAAKVSKSPSIGGMASELSKSVPASPQAKRRAAAIASQLDESVPAGPRAKRKAALAARLDPEKSVPASPAAKRRAELLAAAQKQRRREELHQKALDLAIANNNNPSRRHSNMDQRRSQIDLFGEESLTI